MPKPKTLTPKPLLRGSSHQAAFFFALGACSVLLSHTIDARSFAAILVYTIGVCGLFGISAIYHRPHWSPLKRAWLRRLDHAAIYLLIAGTFTPIGILGYGDERGLSMVKSLWGVAAVGICLTIFWARSPKWLNALLYVGVSWIGLSFFSPMGTTLGQSDIGLILAGGVSYTVGALVYALRRPNPWPLVFGYHEIFHALVVLGAAFHFIVVFGLVKTH